jgi:hypothetical protein
MRGLDNVNHTLDIATGTQPVQRGLRLSVHLQVGLWRLQESSN